MNDGDQFSRPEFDLSHSLTTAKLFLNFSVPGVATSNTSNNYLITIPSQFQLLKNKLQASDDGSVNLVSIKQVISEIKIDFYSALAVVYFLVFTRENLIGLLQSLEIIGRGSKGRGGMWTGLS